MGIYLFTENDLGYATGLWIVDGEYVMEYLNGNIDNPEVFRARMYQTIAPTVVFSNETSDALKIQTLSIGCLNMLQKK